MRGHERWQEWDFRQLLKAIKCWKDINPVTDVSQSEIQRREPTYSPKEKNVKNDGFLRWRSYQTRQDIARQMNGCVYCDKTGHFSANSPKVITVGDRKKILSQKKLCFNCTGDRHRAESCRSCGCHHCQRKHHTSICDQTNNASVGRFLTAQDNGSRSFILLLWSRLMESNAVPSLTLEQAVRMRPLPFWTISASDHFVKNSNA